MEETNQKSCEKCVNEPICRIKKHVDNFVFEWIKIDNQGRTYPTFSELDAYHARKRNAIRNIVASDCDRYIEKP